MGAASPPLSCLVPRITRSLPHPPHPHPPRTPPLAQGTDSALIAVHVQHGQLQRALALYRQLRSEGRWPHPHAMNALLNAQATAFRCAGCVGVRDGGGPALLLTPSPLSLNPSPFPPLLFPPRLGDVVSLVCDMVEGGLQPDAFTFAAVLSACQRADEAELGLDVARWVACGWVD